MNISDYIKESGAKYPLFYQMFSMRSHTTGEYNLLLDGNFNQTLHQLYTSKTDVEHVYITIPTNYNKQSLVDFNELNRLFFENKITLIPCTYGVNADDSRMNYPNIVRDLYSYIKKSNISVIDLVISDFDIPPFEETKTIYRYNISKSADNDTRPVSKYFDKQVEILLNLSCVFLLNDSQKQYILTAAKEKIKTDPKLNHINVDHLPVFVSQNWFSNEWINLSKDWFLSKISLDEKRTLDNLHELYYQDYDLILFPYRLSDLEYRSTLESVINEQPLKRPIKVIVTDPNESIKSLPADLAAYCLNVSKYVPNMSKKALYYYILTKWIKTIPVRYDYTNILHQSILEMAHLCPAHLDVVTPNGIKLDVFEILSSVKCFIRQ